MSVGAGFRGQKRSADCRRQLQLHPGAVLAVASKSRAKALPDRPEARELGAWSLELLWGLDVGAWSLGCGCISVWLLYRYNHTRSRDRSWSVFTGWGVVV